MGAAAAIHGVRLLSLVEGSLYRWMDVRGRRRRRRWLALRRRLMRLREGLLDVDGFGL